MAEAARTTQGSPGRVVPAEREQVMKLLNAPNKDFYRALDHWARNTTPNLQAERIFLHPALFKRSSVALRRWIGGIHATIRRKERAGQLGVQEKTSLAVTVTAYTSALHRLRAAWTKAAIEAGDALLPSLDSLLPGEDSLLKRLLLMHKADPGAFEDAVYMWATGNRDDPEQDKVFQHRDLAKLTHETLTRHLRRLQNEERHAENDEVKRALRYDQTLIGGARSDLKPYVNLSLARRAKGDDEERALTILRRMRYEEYTSILADIKAGKTVKEVEEASKRRLDDLRYGPGQVRPPLKKPNRRKRKRTS